MGKSAQNSFLLIQSMDYVSCVYSWSSDESNSEPLTITHIFIALPVHKTLYLSEKTGVTTIIYYFCKFEIILFLMLRCVNIQ